MVLAVPFATYSLVNWFEKNTGHLPVLGNKGHHIQDFHLVDQDNKIISLADWEKKIVVVDFFFTHCTTICPKMTMSLDRVQKKYAGDREILFNSFSVDPERDSVAQLKSYAALHQLGESNWRFLTGDKKEIYRLARNSFMIIATDGDGGPADFIHSEKLVLVDKQKKIRGFYEGTSEKEVNQLIKDIKKLKNEN
jgi:protein SCO1/2